MSKQSTPQLTKTPEPNDKASSRRSVATHKRKRRDATLGASIASISPAKTIGDTAFCKECETPFTLRREKQEFCKAKCRRDNWMRNHPRSKETKDYDRYKDNIGRDWTFQGVDLNYALHLEHTCGFSVKLEPGFIIQVIATLIEEHDCEKYRTGTVPQTV